MFGTTIVNPINSKGWLSLGHAEKMENYTWNVPINYGVAFSNLQNHRSFFRLSLSDPLKNLVRQVLMRDRAEFSVCHHL